MGKYGEKRIIVSEESAALLLGKAEFIVAMPSGVILDALIMDKPVIEYFNYEKLNSILKNKYGGIPKNAFGGMSCIDEKGRLTSVFRKMNFVIPADTPDELSHAIEKVKIGAFSCGTGDVRKIFPDNSSKLAAETILSMAKNGE